MPLLAALTGPMLSASLWTYLIASSTLDDITVAMLGLIGTIISSGTAVYLTIQANERVKRVENNVQRVNDKVSSPRRISATTGEEGGVVVEPPDERRDDERR